MQLPREYDLGDVDKAHFVESKHLHTYLIEKKSQLLFGALRGGNAFL